MNPTEIDRALRSDQEIQPSVGFHGQVMRAVHAHAASGRKRTPALHDVWPTVAVASVVVPLLIAVRLLHGGGAQSAEVTKAAAWLSFTLTGTLAGVWWRQVVRFP